jgi:hypothetical protein
MIHWVIVSAVEAETTMEFINAQTAIPERNTLMALQHHPQPPTPKKIGHSTALGILNSNIRQNGPMHLTCIPLA